MTPTKRRARAPSVERDASKRAKAAAGTDDATAGDAEAKENARDGAGAGAARARATTMDDLTYDGEIVVASTARELEEAMARIEAFDARAGTTATTKHCGFDMEWKVAFKRGAG